MFRTLLPAALTLALAACAAQSGGRPEEVILTRNLLTVRMTTGEICKGPRASATQTEAGWSGTLQDCTTAYPYAVELLPGTNPIRWVLVEFFTALGGPDVIAPLARVTISEPGGGRDWTFRSPPPPSAKN
ncbi:hypothetical protein [Actibacterium sp. D379-3]